MGEDHVAEVENVALEAHVEENRDEVLNKEEQQNISTESGDESGKNVAEASDVTSVDPIENAGASKTDEDVHVGEETTVEDNEPEQPVALEAEEEKLEHDGGSTEEVHAGIAGEVGGTGDEVGATSSNIESIPADDQTTDPPETGVAADGVVDEPASAASESNDAVVPSNVSDGIILDAGEQQQVPGEGANIGADGPSSQEDATPGVNEEPLVREEDNEKHETEAVQDTPALEIEEGKPEHDDGSTEKVHDDVPDKVGGTSDEVDSSSSNVDNTSVDDQTPETGVADGGVVDEPASAASKSNDPVFALEGIVSDAGEQQQDTVEDAKDISIGVDEPVAVSSQADDIHGVNEEPVAGSEGKKNEKLHTEAVEDTLAIEVEETKPEVGGTGDEVGATLSNIENTSADDQTFDPPETGVTDDGVVDEPVSAPLDLVEEAKDISTGIDEPAAVSSHEEVPSGKEENEKHEAEAIEAPIEDTTPTDATDGIHSKAGEQQVFEEEADVENTGADEPIADVSSREAELDTEPEAGTGEAGNENSEVEDKAPADHEDGPGAVAVDEHQVSATADETTEQGSENFSEDVQEADSSATVDETQQPSENLSSEEPVPEKVEASGDSVEDQVGVIEDRGIDAVTGEEPEHGSAPADEHVDAVSGGETSELVSAADGTRSLDGAVEYHVEDVPAVESSRSEEQAVQEDLKTTETNATDAAPEEGDKVSEAPEQEAEELLPLSNESRFDEKNVGDEVPMKLIQQESDGNVEEDAEEGKEAEENNASILVSEAGDAGGAVDDTKNADERSFVGTPEKSFDEGLLLAAAGSGDQNDQSSKGDDKLAEAETLVEEDVQAEVTPSGEETGKEAVEASQENSSVDEGLVPEVDQESPGGDQAANDSSIVEDLVPDAEITKDDPEKVGEDSLLSQSNEAEATKEEVPEKETGEQSAEVREQADQQEDVQAGNASKDLNVEGSEVPGEATSPQESNEEQDNVDGESKVDEPKKQAESGDAPENNPVEEQAVREIEISKDSEEEQVAENATLNIGAVEGAGAFENTSSPLKSGIDKGGAEEISGDADDAPQQETGFLSETSKDPAEETDVLHPEEIDGDKSGGGDHAATETTASETGVSQVPEKSNNVKAADEDGELEAETPVQESSTGEAAGDEVSDNISTKGVTEELENEELEGEKLEDITESVPKELEVQNPEESNDKQAVELNGDDVEGIKLPAEHEVDQEAMEERDVDGGNIVSPAVETIQPKENLSSPDDEAEDDKENSSLQAEADELKQEPGSGITPSSFFNKMVSAAMNVAKATKPSKKKRLRMKKELQAKLQAVST